MGSFSVACGITKLTISCGDRCLLLPLIIPESFDSKEFKMTRENYVRIRAEHMFLHNTDMWEPFCFPIRGEYNDYGSIENIEKDKNTEILEKYLGISIEDFVSLITDGRRDVYDSFSEYSRVFFEHPEDFEYDTPLDVFFSNLKFKKTENSFNLEDKCHVELLADNKFKAIICGKEKEYSHYDKDNFLKDYVKLTHEYLGISKENIEKMLLIDKIGGMFMLEDAYDFYSKNHMSKANNIVEKFNFHPLILEENGFKTENGKQYKKSVNGKEVIVDYDGEYDKSINKKHFYDTYDFIENYKKITGEDFDGSKYNGMDTFDWQEYIQNKIGLRKVKDNLFNEAKIFELETTIDWDNIDEVFKLINDNPKLFLTIYNIEAVLPYSYLLKECKTLKEIYLKEILTGNIIPCFTEFRRYFNAMVISNVLFTPTFCGTQCGSRQAEAKLAYITSKIVNNREINLKEDSEEFCKEINPVDGFNERYY